MVGDTSLRVVIRADLRTSVTGRDHRLTSGSDVIDIFLMLLIIYLRTQAREGPFFVLRLVTRLGTLNQYLLHFARVGIFPVIAQAHTGLHLVDVLSTRTAGTEGLPFDLPFVDVHFKLIGLGQHRYGSGGSMYASLGLGHRYTLHTVNATLIFERTIYVLTGYIEDDLLVSAGCTFGEGRDRIFESFEFEILCVHTEEIAGEDSCLVSSRTATDLHHHVLSVFRILRQQLQFQFLFQLRYLRFQFVYLRFRYLLHLRVGLVVKQVFRVLQVRHRFLIAMGAF